MKICSVNQNGSFNKTFYELLKAGRLKNIEQRFDFDVDAVVLEGSICRCEKKRQEVLTR